MIGSTVLLYLSGTASLKARLLEVKFDFQEFFHVCSTSTDPAPVETIFSHQLRKPVTGRTIAGVVGVTFP